MKKIEKLTAEQKTHLIEFRKKWLDIGLCCDPADFGKAEEAITFFYEKLGKKKPMFFKFSSPLTCELGYHAIVYIMENKEKFLGSNLWSNLWSNLGSNLGSNLWSNLWSNLGSNLGSNLWSNLWSNIKNPQFTTTSFWGQMDVPWIAFYKFMTDIGIKYKDEEIKLLNAWGTISESACWWMPWENVCIISDRPLRISKDEQGRLHNETKMACEFRDGWGIYTWHGVNIPDKWITNRSSLTPEIALRWENVEQRRVACEMIGWNNVLEHKSLHPKVINDDLPHIGTLIQVDLPDAPEQWFIKYQCGTGRWFAESVNDKSFNTALKANAAGHGWRQGRGDPESYIPFLRT